MDVVEIFLFCVVGFSVLVFLILDSLEESSKLCHEAEKSIDFCGKSKIGSSVVELVEESGGKGEERSVGADGEVENVRRVGLREIAEEEEGTENQVNESWDCSGVFDVSGKSGDGVCGNMGIGEDYGEVEEEFVDDWEGVERTELEKVFGEAVVFVNSKSNGDQLADVKLQLYGLQKVALEGPCHGSQPMALKISARSKWNAWQKAGNISRERAMEKYIDILSHAIPGWKGECTQTIQAAATSEDLSSIPQNKFEDLSSIQQNKFGVEAER